MIPKQRIKGLRNQRRVSKHTITTRIQHTSKPTILHKGVMLQPTRNKQTERRVNRLRITTSNLLQTRHNRAPRSNRNQEIRTRQQRSIRKRSRHRQKHRTIITNKRNEIRSKNKTSRQNESHSYTHKE